MNEQKGRICPQDGSVCWTCNTDGEHFCRIQEAKAALAQVIAERDKMKAGQLLAAAPIISANEALRVKLAEADATCLALRRALETYGQHKIDCQAMRPDTDTLPVAGVLQYFPPQPCTCGFLAVLQPREAQEEK
jgi:hypothetical protein